MDAKKRDRDKGKNQMFKVIKSLSFSPADAELMEVINEYAHMLKGIPPKAAVRNFLLERMPEATSLLRKRAQAKAAG